MLLTREIITKGEPQWEWNPQDDSLNKRIQLRILTLLGVYEVHIVSQLLFRGLGPVKILNPIRKFLQPC